jgi:hypothetical protein
VAWLRQGAIIGKCRERGAGLPEPPLGALSRPDVAGELAAETVAKALNTFRNTVLIPGRWNPARGASLKTFFIGQCLIRFPNIYRAWLKTEVHHDLLVDELAIFDRPPSGGPPTDPAQLAVIRQELDRRRPATLADVERRQDGALAMRRAPVAAGGERLPADPLPPAGLDGGLGVAAPAGATQRPGRVRRPDRRVPVGVRLVVHDLGHAFTVEGDRVPVDASVRPAVRVHGRQVPHLDDR